MSNDLLVNGKQYETANLKQNRTTVQMKTVQNKSMNMPQNYLEESEQASILAYESHGMALKAAKDKWNELGPLRLDDIVANS